MVTVTVCVGSSCHLKGAREVIMRFNELLLQYGLEDRVALRGCFCMERCGEGINWEIDEQPVTSSGPAEAVEVFRRRVLARFGPTGAGPGAEGSGP